MKVLNSSETEILLKVGPKKVFIRQIQKNLSLKPIIKDKTSQRTEKCLNLF